jgi:flagellar biosynthesis protein FlhB
MAESSGDKTEAPTARRRLEARQQGNIARSHDLTSAMLLIGALYLMKWFGPKLILTLRDIVAQCLSGPSLSDFTANGAGQQVLHSVGQISLALAPLFGGAVFIVVVANVVQVGFNFSPQRLAINFSALNPVRGFGKMFSYGQGGIQLLMNLIKVSFVSLMAWSAINGRLAQIISVQRLSFLQIFALGADLVFNIGLRVGILLLILAILDYIYQRFRIEKSLKMTKQEVKDEMRNSEGDPHVKGRIRKLQREMAKRRMMQEVPKADVVITNPTHVAVAIRYDRLKMFAPIVVAKGYDDVAQRIKELAREHDIVQVENIALARALAKEVDIGKAIPTKWYVAVAEVLTMVYKLKKKAG